MIEGKHFIILTCRKCKSARTIKVKKKRNGSLFGVVRCCLINKQFKVYRRRREGLERVALVCQKCGKQKIYEVIK